MAYFHCQQGAGGRHGDAVIVSDEEARKLIASGEFVTTDPFVAMNWEND